jgi:RNA polymerase sigma factor (sigma-70 family)
MSEMPETRASLLARLGEGRDALAWAQFVAIYAPLIHGYARKQGLQDADAADVTQETLRNLAGALGRQSYDPKRGSFRSWLFAVVRNELKTFWTRAAKHVSGSGDSATMDLLDRQPAPEPQADLWDQEYRKRLLTWAGEQVRQAVEPGTWQAFWQTAVEGKPGQEVAKALNMKVAAVYMARSRVQARLKEAVREIEGEDDP